MTRFDTEAKCIEFLVQQRWNGVPECPYCLKTGHYVIEKGKRFKCKNPECHKKYSVTKGSIMEASNIPLTTWLPAFYLVTAHKKGISSVQLSKDLGITQKSAWFLLHRIRESLKEKAPLLLENEVQVDEVYIGGLEGNKHKNKRLENSTGRAKIKTPVIGMLETGGRVVTKVTPWVTKRAATDLILTHVDRKATLVTDAFQIYQKAGHKYNHVIINHAEGQFKVGGHHTNGIENFWSLLSRGIIGIYHQVSPKHLQRYCDEFAFRFNSRRLHDGLRFTLAFHQIEGRLSYKTLINNAKGSQYEGGGSEIETIETGE